MLLPLSMAELMRRLVLLQLFFAFFCETRLGPIPRTRYQVKAVFVIRGRPEKPETVWRDQFGHPGGSGGYVWPSCFPWSETERQNVGAKGGADGRVVTGWMMDWSVDAKAAQVQTLHALQHESSDRKLWSDRPAYGIGQRRWNL